MNYKVIKEFKDKETMQTYEVDTVYVTEKQERADELIEKGYIAAAKTRKKEAE